MAGDAAATAGSSGQGWLTTSTVANPPSGRSKTHPAPESAQPSWPSTSFAHPPKGQRSSDWVTSSRSGLPEKSTATHCVKENLSTGRAYTRFFARWRPNQRVRRARLQQVGQLRTYVGERDAHPAADVQARVARSAPGDAARERHHLAEPLDRALHLRRERQHAHRLRAETALGDVGRERSERSERHLEAPSLADPATNVVHSSPAQFPSIADTSRRRAIARAEFRARAATR